MGDSKTVVLEFPLPEVLMALLYRAFGHHLFLARLVTLAFFIGASVYLFLTMRELTDKRLAVFTASVYTVLPLSQFYSRAIHVDFCAVFLAHAMTFHLIRALRRPRAWEIVLAAALGSLSFLVKAPYAFYFACPLACVAVQKRFIRSFLLLGGCILAAAIPFYFWRLHVAAVNSAAPDWSFIPGYMKFVDMDNWYYGPMSMRVNLDVWRLLAKRFRYDVVSDFGLWLFLLGGILSIIATVRGRRREMLPLWAWLIGVFVYVAIFLNLNYIHDYYQIPLLAVSAAFMAIGIDAPRQLLGSRFLGASSVVSLVMFVGLSANCVYYAQRHYFRQDVLREKAGEMIARVTPPNALVIVAPDIPGTDCRDPRVLFRAGRYGWSVWKRHLSRDLIEHLRREGASHLALVASVPDDLEEAYGLDLDVHSIGDGGWSVVIGDLDRQEPANNRIERDSGRAAVLGGPTRAVHP